MMIVFARAEKKKDASSIFSIHYVAAFAAMRVVANAARNVPAVAVPRLLNFQESVAEFMFHLFCCMK
ncbi:hypothetical protein L195_g009429 [Trifolium pratense]|uniref:Uncharacterized protein n=1 Tax=Trifolium pratense TaxID=57577 RepID=A0A2K3PBX5_TRIPR|nr:hypothetical protein L195_g009429 [Trifolium pratense]